MEERENRGGEDLVAGRNAVAEALRAGRPLDSVLIARGERSGSLVALAAKCRERGIPVKEVDPRKLDALCGPNHQGIAAVAACRGGGAGIQADLKTLPERRVSVTSVIVAVTAQNTLGVQGIHKVPVEFVNEQMHSVFSDLRSAPSKPACCLTQRSCAPSPLSSENIRKFLSSSIQ